MKMNNSVLFVCKKRMTTEGYLTSSGLFNSVSMLVHSLNSMGFDAASVGVVDGNDIDREVFKANPRIVIIEAFWVTPDKLHELTGLHHHKGRKWVVRNHSKMPFLASEGIGLPWLLDYITIPHVNVACNSREPLGSLSEVTGKSIEYLPNIYNSSKPGMFDYIKYSADMCQIDIGCFGALRLFKNHVNQFLAAIIYAKRQGLHLAFHINKSRIEGPNADCVYKAVKALGSLPGVTLVEHPWHTHEQFIALMAKMDLSMQVSYTETFNIVTADAVTCLVPVIGSADIEWLPKAFTADPNSVEDIVEGIDRVLNHYNEVRMVEINSYALDCYNECASDVWEDYLEHHGVSVE